MRFRPFRLFARWRRDNPHDFIVAIIIIIMSTIGAGVMLELVPKSGILIIKSDQAPHKAGKAKGG
jgi:hypothetical protein